MRRSNRGGEKRETESITLSLSDNMRSWPCTIRVSRVASQMKIRKQVYDYPEDLRKFVWKFVWMRKAKTARMRRPFNRIRHLVRSIPETACSLCVPRHFGRWIEGERLSHSARAK